MHLLIAEVQKKSACFCFLEDFGAVEDKSEI
jgi:hypothetical protein